MYGALTQGEGQMRPESIRELLTRQSHRRVGSCVVIPFALELSGQPHLFAKPLIFPLTIIMTSKLAPVSTSLFSRDRFGFNGSTCEQTHSHKQCSSLRMAVSGLLHHRPRRRKDLERAFCSYVVGKTYASVVC